MADFQTELSKLEDLFRSGFIIEDEYAQRKTELLAQQSSAPAAEEKPKEKETDVEQGEEHAGHCCQHGHAQHDHHHHHHHHEGGDDDEDDEDDDEEEIYWECDHCGKEIQGARFHCFYCVTDDDGFDLCRQCRVAGMEKHDPAHKFQIVGPFEVTLDSVKDLLVLARQPEAQELRVLQPYPGITEFEVAFGPKKLLFSAVDADKAEKIVQAMPPGLKVVRVSDEDTAKELAEKEKFAVQPLEGKTYTALEVDFLVKTLDMSSEDAARALEKANGDLAVAIAEGDEDDY